MSFQIEPCGCELMWDDSIYAWVMVTPCKGCEEEWKLQCNLTAGAVRNGGIIVIVGIEMCRLCIYIDIETDLEEYPGQFDIIRAAHDYEKQKQCALMRKEAKEIAWLRMIHAQ